ncbi:MAG: tetratricopeptide repeat protein [Nannocystaceae bacterium]
MNQFAPRVRSRSALVVLCLACACGGQAPPTNAPDDTLPPTAATNVAEEIGELIEAGQLVEGLERVDEEIARTPDNASLHYVRGMALQRLNRRQEAIEAWERAYAADPNLYGALDAIGTAHFDDGDPAKAIEYHRRALAVDSGFADGHFNLGMALVAAGHEDEGYKELSSAATLNPEDADILLELAVLDQKRGNVAGARSRVKAAVQADPHNAFVRMVQGDLHVADGDVESGVAEYEIALQRDPDLGEARMRVVRALRQLGRTDAAVRHVDELVRRSPGSAVAWSMHAQIRFDQGAAEEAMANLERALKINPKLESAHRRKIRFLIHDKKCERAEHALSAFESSGARRAAATKATAEVRACQS